MLIAKTILLVLLGLVSLLSLFNNRQIKKIKTTIQKDREQIADYLNELTKNSK